MLARCNVGNALVGLEFPPHPGLAVVAFLPPATLPSLGLLLRNTAASPVASRSSPSPS